MFGRFFSGIFAAVLFDLIFGLAGPMLASAVLGGVRNECFRSSASFWITAAAVVAFALVAAWRFLRHHDDGWRIGGFLVGFVGPFAFILVALHGAAAGCK